MTEDHTDVLARLDAMAVQEATLRRRDYLRRNAHSTVTEADRAALVSWVQQIQTSLNLGPDAAWLAFSYFDRYLASGRGRSRDVLRNKGQFQLAAVTAFYTAVKITAPVVLGLDMLAAICHGRYDESDFAAMERDMLSALGWRVAVHTPMDVVRHLVEALQVESKIAEGLLQACQEYASRSISDLGLSCCPPSVMGIACLATVLAEGDLRSSAKRALWDGLQAISPVDPSSRQVFEARERLMSLDAPRKASVPSKVAPSRSSHAAVSDGPHSPVCVSQTARQA